jgi:hypothetical protein
MKRNLVVAAVVMCGAVVVLGGCGGSNDSTGACVQFVSAGAGSTCHGGWDKVDCSQNSDDQFFEGKTCADVGYTRPCGSGTSSGCFCLPSNDLCG